MKNELNNLSQKLEGASCLEAIFILLFAATCFGFILGIVYGIGGFILAFVCNFLASGLFHYALNMTWLHGAAIIFVMRVIKNNLFPSKVLND